MQFLGDIGSMDPMSPQNGQETLEFSTSSLLPEGKDKPSWMEAFMHSRIASKTSWFSRANFKLQGIYRKETY